MSLFCPERLQHCPLPRPPLTEPGTSFLRDVGGGGARGSQPSVRFLPCSPPGVRLSCDSSPGACRLCRGRVWFLRGCGRLCCHVAVHSRCPAVVPVLGAFPGWHLRKACGCPPCLHVATQNTACPNKSLSGEGMRGAVRCGCSDDVLSVEMSCGPEAETGGGSDCWCLGVKNVIENGWCDDRIPWIYRTSH